MLEISDHEVQGKTARVHMNGRIYDPNLGRFLSVDPVFEFPTNTQSLNPYSYVLNNSLSMTDLTGYTATDGSICTGPGGATRGCEEQDELPLIFLPAFSSQRAAVAMRLSSAGR